jgi:hypothetical protein
MIRNRQWTRLSWGLGAGVETLLPDRRPVCCLSRTATLLDNTRADRRPNRRLSHATTLWLPDLREPVG